MTESAQQRRRRTDRRRAGECESQSGFLYLYLFLYLFLFLHLHLFLFLYLVRQLVSQLISIYKICVKIYIQRQENSNPGIEFRSFVKSIWLEGAKLCTPKSFPRKQTLINTIIITQVAYLFNNDEFKFRNDMFVFVEMNGNLWCSSW